MTKIILFISIFLIIRKLIIKKLSKEILKIKNKWFIKIA